jgi:hypothetical protein
MLVGWSVGWSVRPSICPSVCPKNEILQNQLTWKTGYVAIASRRGEERGNQLMSKTGYVEIASHLVTVVRSCLLIQGKWIFFYVHYTLGFL